MSPDPALYSLRPFNASDTVILPDPKPRPPTGRSTTAGVPGDVEVAIPVFEACLQVGKLGRAAMVLKRLGVIHGFDEEQLLDMHNQYLHAYIKAMRSEPSVGSAEELHAWYEVQIQERGLPQTAETIAYMLKATLMSMHQGQPKLKRFIERYMSMVPPDQGLDVLYCTDILSDADIAVITQKYPEYNIAAYEGADDMLDAATATETEDGFVVHSARDEVAADGSTVPQVLETPQKGSGLRTIKSTLQVFQKMKDGYDISKLPLHERREFQARLESDCIDAAIERWREMDQSMKRMGLNTSLNSGSMSSHLYNWHVELEKHFQAEFKSIQKAESNPRKDEADLDRCLYGPVLMQSNPSRLAAVTILTCLNAIAYGGSDKGISLSVIIGNIARSIEEDISTTTKEAGEAEVEPEYEAEMEAEHGLEADAGSEESVPRLAEIPKQAERDRLRSWPLALRTKIGALLLNGLAEVAKVRVVRDHPETGEKVVSMQPAFSHTHQFRKGRRMGVLMAHPVLAEQMRKEPNGDFLARHLPMVVEPRPWHKFDQGGYLESPVSLIRMKSGEQDQKDYAKAALERGDFNQVLRGLDVLGKTAWRINRPVFDVFLEAWNSGQPLAKIPPLNPDLKVPPEPEASADPLARRTWQKTLKLAHNLKMSYHSVRCYMNFQLEIARAFRDQEFFFPHNIDFRGRAYPVPTYLNHMGADHVRGLLRFSKGKELGERGLMWLKVHLANVHGFDKASLKEREAFADEHVDDIMDSANNPLNGRRWWLAAEDPWQCLASCFELKAALESPEPTKYVSHMPIHQDGTCNGLQHYAALGGDTWGAQQVNLSPGDRPADVYSAVADLVRKDVVKDAEVGNPIALAFQDKIKRKVVKQTVMTNVYGVTFTGAKKQVQKQIDSLYPRFEEETGIEPGLVASYITSKIFTALSTMFRGAHDIQYWLGEIGGRVCRALTAQQVAAVTDKHNNPEDGKPKDVVTKTDLVNMCRSTIIWTTPLRMPVVQPYRKDSSKVIKTCMQSLVLQNPNHYDPVNRRKQLQAFPPNFIHSLDASHMLLSALECDALGLTFAAVHDSFWTHAADVDTMNRVLRDAFIRIHQEDVVRRLLSEFEARYKGGLYSAHVDKNSTAGKAISKWRRDAKRNISAVDELALENTRLTLLRSSDPAERRKGKAMVTPASIYAELSKENSGDIVGESLEGTGLGSITHSKSALDGADTADSAVVVDEALAEGQDGATVDANSAGASEDGAEHHEGEEEQHSFDQDAEAADGLPIKPIKKTTKTITTVWLPLSFPNVPEKGDFDVSELRNSDYFFS
ncbi:DNA-dependent RNA polymerase [Coniella lustricola]|uniref:DNA-directed RNA polymerase n=1 Tax=Coniella lustricola TaxID=2025994 RepID=A0A2T3A3V2_9PEZI|nr:DNA-dependent RNA polymerase [Coniella lustricola]